MKRYRDLRVVVLTVSVVFGFWANWACADTGNLLQNPGAELGMAYWNGVNGFTTAYTDGWYFYGGDDTPRETYAYQYVDVSAYAQAIDLVEKSSRPAYPF